MNERIAHLHPELLCRLAHDLRGSIAIVLGALDEVARTLDRDGAAASPFLRMARRGAMRSLRIAEGLQHAGELEGGTASWVKETMNVKALVVAAVAAERSLDVRRAVHVEVDRGGEDATVSADPAWLELAVGEVLGNAVRFARTSVNVRVASSGAEVHVTFTDDGPGFLVPLARRVDRPRGTGGVGLSLPMVVDVLAAHGGRLEIDRGPGDEAGEPIAGARVTLVIPALCATLRETGPRRVDEDPGPSARDAGITR